MSDMKLKELGNYKTRKEVETFLDAYPFEKNDFNGRTELLLKVMGNPALFFSIGSPKPEIKYEFVMESFLTGSWRFAKMCRKNKDERNGE